MEGKLYAHLLEVEDAAQNLLDSMMPGMAKEAGVTEKLKARDPMCWVGLMNTCKAQVEEIILYWTLLYFLTSYILVQDTRKFDAYHQRCVCPLWDDIGTQKELTGPNKTS